MPKKVDIIVKESNEIARARVVPQPTSVWEERIISHIVAKNRMDDTAFARHRISVQELANEKRLSTVQYQEVKKAVARLGHTAVEIRTGKRGLGVIPIFAIIDIDDDGNIQAEINHTLKSHYLELDREFTLLSLPEFRALTSIYSQQLYRYLSSWSGVDEKIVLLMELHILLDTPPSFRKDFRSFRKYVLEVAHREINDAAQRTPSDKTLEFEWEAIKEGQRKTVAVRFVFNIVKVRLQEKRATEAAARQERDKAEEIRSAANSCYLSYYRQLKKECTPKKRSPRCKYCNSERGLMRFRQKDLGLDLERSETK
ncbi:MAG: replication initiation protein [Synergistaceae bacterium]|nr:replication initiation protein [Synergistaceae bacterium]